MNLGISALRVSRILNEGLGGPEIPPQKAFEVPLRDVESAEPIDHTPNKNNIHIDTADGTAAYLSDYDAAMMSTDAQEVIPWNGGKTHRGEGYFLIVLDGRLAEDGEGEVRDFQPIRPRTEGPAGVPGPDGKQGVSLTGQPIKALKDRPKGRAWAGDLDHEIPLRDAEDAEDSETLIRTMIYIGGEGDDEMSLIEVEGEYTPAERGERDQYGAQVSPNIPAEIKFLNATDDIGNDQVLSKSDEEAAVEALWAEFDGNPWH